MTGQKLGPEPPTEHHSQKWALAPAFPLHSHTSIVDLLNFHACPSPLMLTKAYDWKRPTTQHIHNTDYSGHVYCEMFEKTRSHIHTYAIHCMGLQHINKLCFLYLFPFISYPSLQAISRPTDLRWIVMLVIHKILHIPCLLQIHLFNILPSLMIFLASVNLVNKTTDKNVFV